MNVNPEHLAVFLGEADDLLTSCEKSLLLLESLPDDRSLLDSIFRCAHTIKGAAAMIEFDALAEFTHEVESLLGKLRANELEVTTQVVEALLASLDIMKEHVVEIGGGDSVDTRSRAATLATIEALVARAVPKRASTSPAPIGVAFPSRNSAALWFDADESSDAELAPNVPIGRQQAPLGVPPNPPALRRGAESVRVVDIDDVAGTLRVPTPKVDRLINLVGEMVTTQSMLSQLVTANASEHFAHLREVVQQMDHHCREMQERVLGIRMLPVRSIFTRFSRVIRDLGAATGKSVVLETSGADTELDKTVLERIGDPLTHLLRNAVDHGIESPDERAAAGKPPTAIVTLNAYHKGTRVFIEVAEDGRGINIQRVIEKARRVGLIAADATPSDDDALNLIFQPGFSTAEAVTAISGRGVGLDAVMNSITALNGTIHVDTRPGKGTRFQIALPTSLAILDGLALRVGKQLFILPLVSIVECIHISKARTRTIGTSEVVDVRGTAITMIRGSDVFGTTATSTRPEHGILVIVDTGHRNVGLLVDDVAGQFQAVQKGLERGYCAARAISGATILGDGRVALIVDPAGLTAPISTSRSTHSHIETSA